MITFLTLAVAVFLGWKLGELIHIAMDNNAEVHDHMQEVTVHSIDTIERHPDAS